jgi:ABC-2 type transport system ATP-binding protein
MRVLLGLAPADGGAATVDGQRYADLSHPLRLVGAALDQGFHPNRTARNHLRITALQAAVSPSRVDEVLALVGLAADAGRRVGGYSLGMRQRLAQAGAVIGDPQILVLDEPFNGLDPAGIRTMRDFLRTFADAGGTVFLSADTVGQTGERTRPGQGRVRAPG